jgi:thioredoxin 2
VTDLLEVDPERRPELATRFDVRGIPNFIVFHGGRPETQPAGLVDRAQMEQWVAIR